MLHVVNTHLEVGAAGRGIVREALYQVGRALQRRKCRDPLPPGCREAHTAFIIDVEAWLLIDPKEMEASSLEIGATFAIGLEDKGRNAVG
jgi:hypothetical protein